MTAAILFIVVLGFLVFVHELGHFWAARLSNIKVTEFGLGLPPKAISYQPQDSEVEYSLNWLPIGGFVKIFGEDYESLIPDDPDYDRSFVKADKWRQLFVLIAGVAMNFLAAILLFSLAAWSGTLVPTDNIDARDGFYVVAVSPGSPAAEAGLQSGDKITGMVIGSTDVEEAELNRENFADLISGSESGIDFIVQRSKDVVEVSVTPEVGVIPDDPDQLAIGVYADSLALQRSGLVEGITEGVIGSVEGLRAVFTGFGSLITSSFSTGAGDTLSSLAGPVGIAQLSEQAFDIGLGSLFSFAAFLSLNLVVLNLLPFPALDGGRIVFVLIEAFKGSPINSKFAGYANLIGFTLLILLMFVVTVQDIIRIF